MAAALQLLDRLPTTQGLVNYDAAGHPLTVEAFNQKDFALFIGTAIYAFEGIGARHAAGGGWCSLQLLTLQARSNYAGMTTPLYNSLSPRGQARFPWTLALTLGGVSVAYVVFGLVPYLYFAGVQHVTMTSAVTLNLPRVWWAFVIKAGCEQRQAAALGSR